MEDDNLLQRLRRFDDERDSVPGEHLMTLAAGALLLTRRSNSTFGWLLSRGLGAALIARGISGRDGPLAAWRSRQAAQAGQAAGLQSVGQDWPAGATAKLAERTEEIEKGWN